MTSSKASLQALLFAALMLIGGGATAQTTATPPENIKLIEDPTKNFVVIMKDGKIYKNTVKP